MLGNELLAPATDGVPLGLSIGFAEARIAAEFERLEPADLCGASLSWWPGEIPADSLVITEAD